MRTGDLIALLAAAPPARPRLALPTRVLAAAFAAGLVSLLVFLATVGARHDLAAAVADPRVTIKFAFAAATALAGFVSCREAARPQAAPPLWPLALPIGLLATSDTIELALTPSAGWGAALMGQTPATCVTLIALSSMLPAAAILITLRRGAPKSPTRAGWAAGLLAGAVGSAIFAVSCPNDSALYVSVWYVAAVALVCAALSLVGRKFLSW